MNNKAFTFIELVVVITIIILISSTGVIYFFKQISSLKIDSEISNINDIIDKLDSEIDTKKILDYSIMINKSDKLGFKYTTNNLGLDYKQKLDLDFETGTGILSTNYTSTGSNYSFKTYSGIKFSGKQIIDASDEFTKLFNKNKNSKIVGTLSGNILNNIYVNYYSSDNLIQDNENRLELISINSKSDKTGTNYNFVEIKNLNGKKYIIPNGGSDILKIYLFFEREGVEKFIEIKK